MRVTFFGAAQEVTGSMHLVEANGQRILLDCGMYQGHRTDTYERNQNFPFDPRSITTLVLSHAHIDHSGDIPLLVKQGFAGHIWCTPATRSLCAYMLMDSAHIQESDAEYLNKRRDREAGTGAGQSDAPILPLYTQDDARQALELFVGITRHRPVALGQGITLTFYEAGHILGSAFVVLDVEEQGKQTRLVFSGDVGRPAIPILHAPEHPEAADFLIMESTYGDRLHPAYADARRELRSIVQETARRRGKVIIPAFAVGRTQEILYALNELDADGDIPRLPIYVDSPLAVNITDVFRLHPEEWDDEVKQFLLHDRLKNPFDSELVTYIRDSQDSKRLNFLSDPMIIISASGMAETGRILHHLANNIEHPENTVLFVGYQAENTLGRRLKEGARRVRILGEECDVRARIASIEGYSAHADQAELLDWASGLDRGRLAEVFLVHGEPPAAEALAAKLRESGVRQVTVPQRGQACTL